MDWGRIFRSNLRTNDIVEQEENKRRFQTHGINQHRHLFVQYHTLFELLKKYPKRLKNYTRMSLCTFKYILSKIEARLTKNWCNFHRPVYPEEQLVVTLRFLITGSSYNDLASTFLLGEATVCTIVKDIMSALWDKLQPFHIPVPKKDELRKTSDNFYRRWNFPHCLGAIDCCHIRIKKPAHSKSLFYNWKKFYSIKLQAVVDAYYRFIFIEVGDYGSTHDSTTFKNSRLFHCLQNGRLQIPGEDKLPDSKIILPYFFIGDGAYMLQEHLMKPFRGKNVPVPQQTFNKRLSRARMVIECAFGQLVQMWKIFKTTMECTPETAALITKCACLLRNVIIDMEGTQDEELETEENGSIDEDPLFGDEDCKEDFVVGQVGYGREVREELVKYVMQHPIE